MRLRALFLNCTLKKSPKVSNTRALIDKVVDLMEPLGVDSEVIRVVDHDVAFGVSSDEAEGDEWPKLLKKIKACDILIIGSPIWFGVRSAVAQMVLERLDGTYGEGDPETGQFPLYGKVGGVIVTGNEDGAHLGCTIPPNCDSYWVGDAGPGPSYIEAGGDKHMYTNKTARYLAHNVTYFARLLRENPIPTNLNQLIEEARQASCDDCPERHG
jgi:multimeric flavodoxin WrbA